MKARYLAGALAAASIIGSVSAHGAFLDIGNLQVPKSYIVIKGTKPIEYDLDNCPIDIETALAEAFWQADEADVVAIAKTLWGECRGIPSRDEKAAVAWVIVNRADDSEFPDTIPEVVTQRGQFAGYNAKNPVSDELREIAVEVLTARHTEEITGETSPFRVLPKEYRYFHGDGKRNYFTKNWRDGQYWKF